MTQTEQLSNRFSEAVSALCRGLDTIITLARGLADSEAALPDDRRPAARSRYLIRLYEVVGTVGSGGISQIYAELIALRPQLPPTAAETAMVDRLAGQCRDVLEQVDILQHSLLPQHMRAVSDCIESTARMDRNITAGLVRSLEILMRNIQKYYCPQQGDVL